MNELMYDGFSYHVESVDRHTQQVKWALEQNNLIPSEGLRFLIRSPFGQVPPVTSFYVGLIDNNYVPVGNASAADIGNAISEFYGYEEVTRPQWVTAYDGDATQGNAASRAVFTPDTARTLYGCFIASASTKGATSGILLSVMRFGSPRDVEPGEEVRVRAGITYIPATGF